MGGWNPQDCCIKVGCTSASRLSPVMVGQSDNLSDTPMSSSDDLGPVGFTIARPQQSCGLVEATIVPKALKDREGCFLTQLNPTFKARELFAGDVTHRSKRQDQTQARRRRTPSHCPQGTRKLSEREVFPVFQDSFPLPPRSLIHFQDPCARHSDYSFSL